MGEETKERSTGETGAPNVAEEGSLLFLYVVVFVCGAVLMALEIIGSRVLAPYFGNSIFVWGSLISIFLMALTVGYYLGGIAADRWPRLRVMALLVAAPGILIGLLPFVYPTVNLAIAAGGLGARWAPLVAGFVLFLAPSVFLGTVSPFAIRLAARAMARVGRTAGRLYAVSTAGSILGTIVTAFYLIGIAGVARVVHLLGLVLIILATSMLLVARQRAQAAVAALLVAASSWISFHERPPTNPNIVLEEDTFYHHVRVGDEGDRRFMIFDNLVQSVMSLTEPTRLELPYSHYMSLAFAFRPDPTDAALIGLGGGSLPKAYLRAFPKLRMDAVEIDPEVVRIAIEHFALAPDPRLVNYVEDGRLFLLRSSRPYDIVFLDAYNSDTIPFHLVTREYFQEIKARLKPGGVLTVNIVGHALGPHSRLFRAIHRTLGAVFSTVYAFVHPPSGSLEERTNIIAIATDAPPIATTEIARRAATLGDRLLSPERFDEIARNLMPNVPTDDVPLLTDDFAPVDQLLHF